MNLPEIKRAVRALPPRKLVGLDAWLHQLIDAAESQKRARAAVRRAALKGQQTINKTYRLEGVRCGSKSCKCVQGELHGPYWYAYWTEGGRTRSQYVGKKLPKGVGRRPTRRKVSDNLR
jgi:hypothetical protein